MKRALLQWFPNVLLVSLALACAACGETSSGAEPIILPLAITSQNNIVSEDGVLELSEGNLSIRSVTLVGIDGNVRLIGPLTVDLAVPDQGLELESSIPPGEYTGLQIELAPAAEEDETLDVQLRLLTTEESVRATSGLLMTGAISFPEGPRSITTGSDVQLHILLRGMFFYLAPISDAVDGHYDAGENQRDFIMMDLINMFDLRVLP